MFNVLYLQKDYSKNANPLKGRKLFESYQQVAEKSRLGYIVRPSKNVVEEKYYNDVVTYEELEEFAPDVIFVEGGILNGDKWRIEEEIIEKMVTKGVVVIISDLDWNILSQFKEEYQRFFNFSRISVAYDNDEPVELYDSTNYYKDQRIIVCNPEDIAYESWLEPVYKGLDKFVVSMPVPLRSWIELVATCNRYTTHATSHILGMHAGEHASGSFASMCRFGLGYLVVITGNVSNDVWIDAFPGNIEWLIRLSNHLLERVRIERRRNTIVHQIFISHRHRNKDFADSFRDELRRRGFGTWLDSRELIAGDDLTPEIRQAIENCTHFVILWCADCHEAAWIILEYNFALAMKKRIFIVRLDDTTLPSDLADKLRIEAQVIGAKEAAKNVSMFIEREERRKLEL